MIVFKLEEARFADSQTKERIIQELADNPEETLIETIAVLGMAAKPLWKLAIQVIRLIGYPRNAIAIPALIDQVADGNSPARNEAMQTLIEMGVEAVSPYFIQTMLERKSQKYWIDAIHGICTLLTLRTVGREYAVPCGPAITYLLGQDELSDDFEKLDPEYLLDALEKIGPECAVYALPTLLQRANKEGASRVGQQTRNLLASFDKKAREPYKLLLAALQNTEQKDQ